MLIHGGLALRILAELQSTQSVVPPPSLSNNASADASEKVLVINFYSASAINKQVPDFPQVLQSLLSEGSTSFLRGVSKIVFDYVREFTEFEQ